MKKTLISLHTEDADAVFDNIFNDELIIEPDSELAFHSCCLRLNNFRINVSNSNKIVTLKIGNTDAMRFVMDDGQYADTQITYLLETIQNGFNKLLDINNGTDNGQQIRAKLSRKNVVQFDLLKAPISQAAVQNAGDASYEQNVELFLTGGDTIFSTITGTYGRTPGTSGTIGGDLDSFVHGKVEMTRGCGACIVDVVALAPQGTAGVDGCLIQLTHETNPDVNNTRTNSLLYVRVPFTLGEAYKYATREGSYHEEDVSSNVPNTPLLCEIGDQIQIQLTRGQYHIRVYRTGVDVPITIPLLSREAPVYNDTDTGYVAPPVYFTIGIIGPSFRGRIMYMADPYDKPPPDPNKLSLAVVNNLTTDPPEFSKGDQYDHVLTFQQLDVASGFGYDEREIIVTSTDECTFLAEQSIINSNHPSNFKIEMLNIQLESFDSQREGRMNILATIPVSKTFKDEQLSILNFEPANMFYLSIRNQTQLSLRNIRARIIDANNNPINLLGFSSINLLIKPSDKK
tara:strand:+ start:1380 stop:2921 length:1542 start_codon:yes stop_codon:yes gene_type:complete